MRYLFVLFLLSAFVPMQTTVSIQELVNSASDGDVIYLDAGVYVGNVTLYPKQNISIVGAGVPNYDGENLTGGTVIVGKVDLFDSVGSSLSNLGIDVHDSNINAIDTGSLVPYEQHRLNQRFINLSLAGNDAVWNAGNASHGIRIQGGSHITIDNVTAYHFAHGIAIRGSWVNVSNVYSQDPAQTAVIVKAADTTGNAEFVNISNVQAQNFLPSSGGRITVQSISETTVARFVNISNAVIDSASAPAITIEQIAGVVSNVNVSNVIATNNKAWSYGVFYVNGASNIIFTACQSVNGLHVGEFYNTGTNNTYLP